MNLRKPGSLSLSHPNNNDANTLTFILFLIRRTTMRPTLSLFSKLHKTEMVGPACFEGSGSYLTLVRLLADPRLKVLKVDSRVVSEVDSKAGRELYVSNVAERENVKTAELKP